MVNGEYPQLLDRAGGTKLARISPWAKRSAIHIASFTSVLRPGTALMLCAFATR